MVKDAHASDAAAPGGSWDEDGDVLLVGDEGGDPGSGGLLSGS